MPFSKLTCESEYQGITNLEALKITGLRERVQLREETASCTYISQTIIIYNTRNFFYFTTSEFNEILLTSATQVWYTSLTRPLFFIGLACARLSQCAHIPIVAK